MKKNINTLILLIALMTGVPVFAAAQNFIAPSLKEHANTFPEKAQFLLNKAGFDDELTTPSGQSRFTELQLDSTIVYGFSPTNVSDSISLMKTVYTYPDANRKFEISSQFEGAAWTPLNRITTHYDDKDRIVEVFAQTYDSLTSAYVNDSKLETYYHNSASNLIDSFAVSQWSPELKDWVVQLSTRNVFDSENKIIESYSTIGFLGEPVIFKDRYFYDDQGDNHLIESSAIFEGEEITTGLTENTFLNHLLTTVVVYTTDGINFLPDSRETFLYAPFGFLARHSIMEWNVEMENWELVQTIDHQYDEEQRLSEKFITYYEDGVPADGERPTYEYVEGNHLALETNYLFDEENESWSLDTKKYYYYNDITATPNEPIQVLTLTLAPNPTTDVVTIGIEEMSTVQLFTSSGQMIESRLVQPGQMMDLSFLPAGIYQLVAQNSTGYYSGRIIKL